MQLLLPTSVYWTIAVLLLSAALWASLRKTRWSGAAGWTALALAGQACSLQLLDVGSANVLQHFASWEKLLQTWQGVFLAALVVQAAIVARGIVRMWPAAKPLLPRLLTKWQWLVLLALEAYAAITIALQVARALFLSGGFATSAAAHATKMALGLTIFAVGALNLILAVAAIPEDAWAKLAAWWEKRERPRLAWLAAGWVVIVSALLAWLVFAGLPHVPDEVGYLFMAKYLAQGKLWLAPPPEAAAFTASFLVIENGRWFSVQLPGWPAVLSLGVRGGAPWLVNPLLGGIAILLAHALVKRLYERKVADGVALLMAASPWLLFVSASMMPHPASLVFSLAALLGVYGARETGSPGWAAVAGLSSGALLLTRPLEGVIVAAFCGIWWLAAGWKKLRIAALATTVICGLAMTALLLSYNKTMTGDPWNVPFGSFMDKPGSPGPNRLGFGPAYGNFGWSHLDALPGHGLTDVLMNSNQNLYMINFGLFGWASGSLLFVFLLCAWGEFRRERWMWGFLLILWAGLNTYWFGGGPDFGARYWYQMILPLAVLTVRGGQLFAEKLAALGAPETAGQRVWAFMALASVLGGVNLLPWSSLDKYVNYRGVRGDVRQLAKEYNFGRSLVLVRGEPPVGTFASSAFYSAFALNPPRYDRDAPGPIYALDLGAKSVERLREYYADRPVWVLASPSITGEGFQVLEGPLPAKSGGGRK